MVTEIAGLSIDDMKLDDIPDVLAIENISFTMPWTEMLFNNEIHNPRTVCRAARIQGSLAGYICFKKILDEGHIHTLAVHPDYRRKGIAHRLVSEMLSCLKEDDCRFIFLEVRISNEPARKLYEGFGFRVIGTRKDYYISPVEDGLMMSLRLDQQSDS